MKIKALETLIQPIKPTDPISKDKNKQSFKQALMMAQGKKK